MLRSKYSRVFQIKVVTTLLTLLTLTPPFFQYSHAGEGDGVLKKYKIKISDPKIINQLKDKGYNSFQFGNEGRNFNPIDSQLNSPFRLNMGKNNLFQMDFFPRVDPQDGSGVLLPKKLNANKNNKKVEIDVEVPNPDNFDPDNPKYQKLTLSFARIPSTQEIVDAISEALSPPGRSSSLGEDPCDETNDAAGEPQSEDNVALDPQRVTRPVARPEDLMRPKDSDQYPAAKGARMVLGTFFQSCKAMDLKATDPTDLSGVRGINSREMSKLSNDGSVKTRRKRNVTNLNSYVGSHYLLSALQADKENGNYPTDVNKCSDSTLVPPVYGYGAKAANTSEEIDLFKPRGQGNSSCSSHRNMSNRSSTEWSQGVDCRSASVTAIDCSGLVSMALKSQGLRFWPKGNDDNENGGGTSTFRSMANNSNSCIGRPELTLDNMIKPGDLLNRGSSHVVMIDVVGDDPFGIKKVLDSDDKNCANISIDDFDITFIHSGSSGNMGPARIHTSALGTRGGSFWGGFVSEARRACQKFKNNETFQTGSNSRVGILRHKTSNPECMAEPEDIPKLKGSECVEQCI